MNRNYPGGTPSATITSGTLTSASGVGAVQAYTWASNAKAEWADAKSNTSISGGTFSSDVMNYCVSGYETVEGENGTYKVEDHRIAEIDSVGYASMQKAVDAAKDGDTIKMLADVDLPSCVAINKSITLDLNGKKIYNTKDFWYEGNKDDENDKSVVAMFDIEDGANVTITGNGTVEAKKNDCYNFNIVKGSLTIENGTFMGNVSVVQVQTGLATIKGGKFADIQEWKTPGKYLINCIDENWRNETAKVSISGGTFVNFNPANAPENPAGNFCAPGYKTELTNGVYVVKSGTNDALEAIDKALADDASDAIIKAAVDAVASTPNETLADSSTTMDKLAKLEDKVTNNKITVEENSTVAEVKDPVATNAKLSADPEATTDQKITIDVTSSNASTDAATALVGDTAKSATAMDITMKLNGEKIQPKAPVVLTFDLPANWANAQIVYMNGDKAEKIPTTVSNGTISGVFNHFSTYVLVQTAAAENPNKYEIILTPDKTDVSAGDEITYTVSLKHTYGSDDDQVGMFTFVPAESDLLKLESGTAESGIVWGHIAGSDSQAMQFNFTTPQKLATNATMKIGTLTYKVKAYDTDGVKVVAAASTNEDEETAITNKDYLNGVPELQINNDKDVTYHKITLTFTDVDGSKTIRYARYDQVGLYEDLSAMYNGNKLDAAPEIKSDADSTTYRLVDKNWHLSTQFDTTYAIDATKNIIDAEYITNNREIVKVDIPNSVAIDDSQTNVVDRPGGKYIDKGEDLIFTVDNPDAGMKNKVTATVGNGTPEDLTPAEDGNYKVDGKKITGEVTIEVTQELNMSAEDIKIFTTTAGEESHYIPYSTYSGNDTLVVFKGKDDVSYKFTAGDAPEIFKLPSDGPYDTTDDTGYTHAVLIPFDQVKADKAGMLAKLNDLGLSVSETNNTEITYDWKTSGKESPKLVNVNATYLFTNTNEANLKGNSKPTDEMLLKADVMNLKENTTEDVYSDASYTEARDGHVNQKDVITFMYNYAKIAGGNQN